MLPTASIQDALNFYEQLTGKILIKEANLEGAISLIIPGPIPKREAAKLIEAALLLNRIAIIPNDEISVKVVNVGSRNPRSEAIPFYASVEDVPALDTVVSLFMPLRFLAPEEAERIFRTQVQFNEYGTVVPVPNARAVIVTENAKVVRALAQIKTLIDVPPEPLLRKFVILERADAEKVAEMIKQMLDERSGRTPRPSAVAAAGTPNAQPALAEGMPPVPGAVPSGANLEVPGQDFSEVQLIPDTRTNRILVVATKQNFASIAELIREFDSASAISAPFVHRLRYVLADEILPVLRTVLSEDSEETGREGGAAPATPRGQTRPATQTPGGANEQLGAAQERNPPQAIIVGRSRVIADPRAGTIIVFGPPEALAKAKDVMDRLDQRPEQVYLATVIGEMQITNSFEWTIDLIQNFQRSGEFGGASSVRTGSDTLTALIDPRTLRNAANFPLNPGLSLYGAFRDTLNATVNLLDGTGRFRVLNKPSVFAKNNRKALIETGEQVAVPTTSVSTVSPGGDNNTAITSNIGFRDVVLQLEVIPQINADREVTLTIAQKNDTRGADTIISGNRVPNINTQRLNTEVTVPDKSTILLGGLVREDARTTSSGVPWLSSIPLLGYLFKSEERQRRLSELIVLIQPTVVTSQEEEQRYNEEIRNRSAIGRDSAAFMDGDSPLLRKENRLNPVPERTPEPTAQPSPEAVRVKRPARM
ncbi:MAG: hypothetical protein OHK005_13250 [Candidatus Methylacidiphilales bacterium]